MGDTIVMQLVSRVLNSGCTPEDACRDSPELLAEVREELRRIESLDVQLEGLFPETESSVASAAKPARSVDALPHVPGHEVLSVLGHGGMGVVYKARHVRLNRNVAVKMLLGGAHTDHASLKRLLREAEAVAALRHPNIVQVHEVGDHGGLPYFTMDLVEGGSLREKLESGVLDARGAASLLAKLAEAMEVAHASGIIHRDLKPANVLLTPDGVPMIVDFGLARRFESDSSLTRTDALLGTPSYMAPEQARGGSHAAGPAADVYALGAILYATLTGRPPFRSDVFSATLRQVIEDEPVRPSRRNPRVPRDLETICLKCLNKDPARRYVTAAALAADLQRFLRGEPILARPIGFLERTGKWVRRRPAHATIAAGTVLAILALVGAGLWLGFKRGAVERAVKEDFLEVDRAAASADWSAVRTALERARARLMDGGSADLLAKVEQGARELALVDTLDAIRIRQFAITSGKMDRAFNQSQADAAYARAFSEFGLADVPKHSQEVAAVLERSRIRSVLVSALDNWSTCVIGDAARRDGLLAAVRRADPDPTGWRDRVRDAATWNDKQALAELTSAAPVSMESVALLLALAEHVILAGSDAVPFLERVQREYPGDFWSNFTLGLMLVDRDAKAAVRYFQAAVAVRPDSAVARGNLGTALAASQQLEEAVVQLRKSIDLDPTCGLHHANLARCYFLLGSYVQAVESFQAAIRLDPSGADTLLRYKLGGSLVKLGRLDEAIEVLRELVRLDPQSRDGYYSLGFALHAAGQPAEAEAEFRRAIAIDPRYVPAHESLAFVVKSIGRLDDAIACFRDAVRLNPQRRDALIEVLIASGRFEEARTEAELIVQSLSASDPQQLEAKALLNRCELLTELAADLPAVLDGARAPQDASECLAFADLFRAREDYAAATRYFADAFDRDAGASTRDGDRRAFDAARCAAMAGVLKDGAGDVAGEEERANWRVLALAWLRQDLAVLDARLTADASQSGLFVLLCLADWKADPALAGFRDSARLERLPENERTQWQALWNDADSLSTRARSAH